MLKKQKFQDLFSKNVKKTKIQRFYFDRNRTPSTFLWGKKHSGQCSYQGTFYELYFSVLFLDPDLSSLLLGML